jgi:sulfhydrogenase subunit alpha
MTRTVRIDHLARVEGHGGVTVELDGNDVRSVRFDIFEGARLLEGLVKGRTYQDVSTLLSRICAICSVAHAVTSLKATEAAFGVEVSPQTKALRDLLFLGESIESHALHLFLLALPDYLKYPSAIAMAADHREAVQLGLRLKKLGNAIQETVGGRAVHPVNAVPGGFGRAPDTEQLIELRRGLLQAVTDAETTVGIFAGLPPAEFCRTDTAFAALRAPSEYGYYDGDEIEFLTSGETAAYPCSRYREVTNERAVAHSHAKHSMHKGRPYMVGALARLSLNASKLSGRAARAVEQLGLRLPSPNPMDNNKAQAVELVSDVERALGIVESLLDADIADETPVPVVPRAGTGTAVTEAPRGLLIHSYTYDDEGRILTADVITPTALNAASVEAHLRDAALGAAPGGDETLVRAMEMIVRAYDPCISCSVHLIRRA